MTAKQVFALTGLLALTAGNSAFADDFSARLGRVPVDSRTQSSIAGIGHASAELNGQRLAIAGDFEGMLGAATSANLHLSPAVGVRGPVIYPLQIETDASGRLSGNVTLKADEVAALRAGRLYIQIASESAPEGNLWGWLLEQ